MYLCRRLKLHLHLLLLHHLWQTRHFLHPLLHPFLYLCPFRLLRLLLLHHSLLHPLSPLQRHRPLPLPHGLQLIRLWKRHLTQITEDCPSSGCTRTSDMDNPLLHRQSPNALACCQKKKPLPSYELQEHSWVVFSQTRQNEHCLQTCCTEHSNNLNVPYFKKNILFKYCAFCNHITVRLMLNTVLILFILIKVIIYKSSPVSCCRVCIASQFLSGLP